MAKLVRLMALIAAGGMLLGSVGCKQKEETPTDEADQRMEETKEKAEDAAEEAADEGEEAMDEAEESMD